MYRRIVCLKNRNLHTKIDGWTYRYAGKFRPGIELNASVYLFGIAQCYVSMKLLLFLALSGNLEPNILGL